MLAKVADLAHTRIFQLPAEAELPEVQVDKAATAPHQRASNRPQARRSSLLRRASPSFSFPVLDESPRLLPGELPAVPDFSPNSRAVQIAMARLPFPAAGLSRRKASARTLCSPSASVTGPCVCRPCPSPARAALFLLSGLLVFPLSCEGKTHQTIPLRRKHTMATSAFQHNTNWRIITS